jgi:hypothetical protein
MTFAWQKEVVTGVGVYHNLPNAGEGEGLLTPMTTSVGWESLVNHLHEGGGGSPENPTTTGDGDFPPQPLPFFILIF